MRGVLLATELAIAMAEGGDIETTKAKSVSDDTGSLGYYPPLIAVIL